MSRPVPRDSNTTQGPLLLRRQLGRALKPPRDHPRDHSRDHSCHRTGPGSGGAGQAEDAAWQRPRRARIQRHQWLDPEQRLQWLDPELPGREWPAQKGRGGPQSGCRGAESGSSQRIRGQACANQRGQLGAAAPAWGAAAEAAASGRQRECIQGSDSTRAVVWAGVGMGHGSRKGRAAGQLHRRGLRVEAPLPAPRAAEAPPARRAARLQPPRRRPHVRPPPPAPPLRRRFSAAAPTPGLTARRRGLCAPARREARGWGPRTLSGKDRPTSVLDAGCAVLSFLPLASDRAAAAAGVAVALPLLAMASPRGAVGFVRQVRATPPSRRRDAACPISTGRGTRRVQLVRGEGLGVSDQYEGRGGGGLRCIPPRCCRRAALTSAPH